MTINKYVLCTNFICFFMFFSNSFIHSENANAENPFKGFNIHILKDMKTSAEMVDFLIIKFDKSKEELQQNFFDSEFIGALLSIKPEKVKDISAQLLEKTKRKAIIYMVCRHGIMDEVLAEHAISDEELAKLSPELRNLHNITESTIMNMCIGDDF